MIAKKFFVIVSRNQNMKRGYTSQVDPAQRVWINNQSLLAESPNNTYDLGFHVITDEKSFYPMLYLDKGKFVIESYQPFYLRGYDIMYSKKAAKPVKIKSSDYDIGEGFGDPQLGLLLVNRDEEIEIPFQKPRSREIKKVKAFVLNPVYDELLYKLRSKYITIVPNDLQKEMKFYRARYKDQIYYWGSCGAGFSGCGDHNGSFVPWIALRESEVFWDKFMEYFTTVKEHQKEDSIEFGVSIDLSLGCQFAKERDSLISK